jgi:hypothetical protein
LVIAVSEDISATATVVVTVESVPTLLAEIEPDKLEAVAIFEEVKVPPVNTLDEVLTIILVLMLVVMGKTPILCGSQLTDLIFAEGSPTLCILLFSQHQVTSVCWTYPTQLVNWSQSALHSASFNELAPILLFDSTKS